jgi:hypothetical protein
MNIEDQIAQICRQTDYDDTIATAKLAEFGTVQKVIRDYMGLPLEPPGPKTAKTLNQEIYRQFRGKLNIEESNRR